MLWTLEPLKYMVLRRGIHNLPQDPRHQIQDPSLNYTFRNYELLVCYVSL
jgi:hypothetical protein